MSTSEQEEPDATDHATWHICTAPDPTRLPYGPPPWEWCVFLSWRRFSQYMYSDRMYSNTLKGKTRPEGGRRPVYLL